MTTELNAWLTSATRSLSKASTAQVRREIEEHYEAAQQAAIDAGATDQDAGRMALTNLGDPIAANRQYRTVLLTSSEARMLRSANWEARAVCSRKWQLLAIPVAVVACISIWGELSFEPALLVGGLLLCLLLATPFLPVYTKARGRLFRVVRWGVLVTMLALAFGPNTLQWSWLIFSSLWPLIWVEWTRFSVRRKLPVGQWPKHLFL